MIHKINFLLWKERGPYPLEGKQINISRETDAVCLWNETKYRYVLLLKKYGVLIVPAGGACTYYWDSNG
jgi:hypothetical protein